MIVVQMHGEPGSGKSTIARELGARLGAVVLDKDVIKTALLRSGVVEAQAGVAAYEVFHAQARALTAAGHAIILDSPVYWESVERRWLEISRAAGSAPILIACVCGDRAEIRRRLASREALESQMRAPLDLAQNPGAGATRFEPRLTLDTTRPVEESVALALDYVHAGVPA